MGLSNAMLMFLCVQVSKNTQDPEWNYEAQVTLPDQGDKTITIEVCFHLMDKVFVSKSRIRGRFGSVKPKIAVRSFVHAAQ